MHYSEWRPESQITAYAWSWFGSGKVHSRALKQDLSNEKEILVEFMRQVEKADIVVGHYLRQHDLPLINDHCARLGIPGIDHVLVQDTKCDLLKVKGLGLSQENLALEFELTSEKHGMSGALWRRANTLSPEGTKSSLQRVVSDVRQNMELRDELLRRGLLSPPRIWSGR